MRKIPGKLYVPLVEVAMQNAMLRFRSAMDKEREEQVENAREELFELLQVFPEALEGSGLAHA